MQRLYSRYTICKNIRLKLSVACLLIVAACSGEPRSDAPPKPSTQTIDYVQLFETSDTVGVCASNTYEFAKAQMGPDFLDRRTFELGCQCESESIMASVREQAPDNPKLAQIIMQFTMDINVAKAIRNETLNPTGVADFVAFLNEKGEAIWGFDAQTFHDVYKQTANKLSSLNRAEVFAHLKQIPSCTESFQLAQKVFPEQSLDEALASYNLQIIERPFEFDPGVDLDSVDSILFHTKPEDACPQAYAAGLPTDMKKKLSKCDVDFALFCRATMDKLDTRYLSSSPNNRQYAKRRSMLWLYRKRNASTATKSAFDNYTELKATDLGLSVGEVKAINDTFLDFDKHELRSQYNDLGGKICDISG